MPIEPSPNESNVDPELHGGAWRNSESWAARSRPEGCIVCTSGRPSGVLLELPHTWVTTDPEVAIFGYVCVLSKVHAVEPFDLPDSQQVGFWADALAVARRLNEVLHPIKMNYEIHGNTLPHLHMHLLPRQANDAFVGRPIDLKERHHRYSNDEIAMLKKALDPLLKVTD